MGPLAGVGIAAIAAMAIGAILASSMDGADLAMTAKTVADTQGLKAAEKLRLVPTKDGLLIENRGSFAASIVAIKATDPQTGLETGRAQAISVPGSGSQLVSGYDGQSAVRVVTSMGNTFEAAPLSAAQVPGTAASPGIAALNGMGIYTNIVSRQIGGNLLLGQHNQTLSFDPVRPHSLAGDADYAFLVHHEDPVISMIVPSSDSAYRYDGGSLEIINEQPNMLGDADQLVYSTVIKSLEPDYVVLKDSGQTIFALNSALGNKTLRFSGTAPVGTTMEIADSVYDLEDLTWSSHGFKVYSGSGWPYAYRADALNVTVGLHSRSLVVVGYDYVPHNTLRYYPECANSYCPKITYLASKTIDESRVIRSTIGDYSKITGIYDKIPRNCHQYYKKYLCDGHYNFETRIYDDLPARTTSYISILPKNFSASSDQAQNISLAFDDDTHHNGRATVPAGHTEVIIDLGASAKRSFESMHMSMGGRQYSFAEVDIYVDTNIANRDYISLGESTIRNKYHRQHDVGYEGVFRHIKIASSSGQPLPEFYIRSIDAEIKETDMPLSVSYLDDNTAYFEADISVPAGIPYMIVDKDRNETLHVRAEQATAQAAPRLEVRDLPPHIPYVLEKDGIVLDAGKTSASGLISVLSDDIRTGNPESPEITLRIYPESTGYLQGIGLLMIDEYNSRAMPLPLEREEDAVYVPHAYVRWVFPTNVTLKNVTVDGISFAYLDGPYAPEKSAHIPVIPGMSKISAYVDGVQMTVPLKYVHATTQLKPIPVRFSTGSGSSDGSKPAYALAEASSSAFLTATQDGTMYAIVSLHGVSGNVGMSLHSDYAGSFKEYSKCVTYVYKVTSTRCAYVDKYHPYRSTIDSINSRTSSSVSSHLKALERGELSSMSVSIDVYKNLQYVQTVQPYAVNAAVTHRSSGFDSAEVTVHAVRSRPLAAVPANHAAGTVGAIYGQAQVSANVELGVEAGDMVEFIVRASVDATAKPPISASSLTYSRAQAAVSLAGGSITVGMA